MSRMNLLRVLMLLLLLYSAVKGKRFVRLERLEDGVNGGCLAGEFEEQLCKETL